MADLDTTALEYLTQDDLLRMYRTMRLSRLCEERLIALFRSGELAGAVFTGIGMEATAVGFGYAMGPQDVVANMHRELGALFLRGWPLREYFCQWFGRANGTMRGRDGNMHMGDPKRGWLGLVSQIGAGVPVATGAALSFKLRGQKDRVAWAPHGDGSTSTGYWHEGVNFGAVNRLPVVYVCINNQWAISTPVSRQTAAESIAAKAVAYGMPGVRVDGNDPLAVYAVCRKARERAAAGEGPTLVECLTFRVRGHSEADRADYLPKDQVAEWKKKDPVDRFRNYLLETGALTEAAVAEMDKAMTADIDDACDFARKSPLPDPAHLTDGVYSQEVR